MRDSRENEQYVNMVSQEMQEIRDSYSERRTQASNESERQIEDEIRRLEAAYAEKLKGEMDRLGIQEEEQASDKQSTLTDLRERGLECREQLGEFTSEGGRRPNGTKINIRALPEMSSSPCAPQTSQSPRNNPYSRGNPPTHTPKKAQREQSSPRRGGTKEPIRKKMVTQADIRTFMGLPTGNKPKPAEPKEKPKTNEGSEDMSSTYSSNQESETQTTPVRTKNKEDRRDQESHQNRIKPKELGKTTESNDTKPPYWKTKPEESNQQNKTPGRWNTGRTFYPSSNSRVREEPHTERTKTDGLARETSHVREQGSDTRTRTPEMKTTTRPNQTQTPETITKKGEKRRTRKHRARRQRDSSPSSTEMSSDEDSQTSKALYRRVKGMERAQYQMRGLIQMVAEMHSHHMGSDTGIYKKKKKDCPPPEKFQGTEGEACEIWLELFHEWANTQNLTPKAEVAALLKSVGKIPSRVLNNLPPDERWDPQANYRALQERWSHGNAREVNRKDFSSRKQREGESLEEYMDELCRIRRSGWKGESTDTFEEAVKNAFWIGIKSEVVMEQMWNILQLQELQDISLKEVLANAKRAKYVTEQKGLRNRQPSNRPNNYTSNANYEPRQERGQNTFKGNGGKCYGCGGAHMIADCKDPFLMKNGNNVKMMLESGTSENELWELAQRAAEADYCAESIARCIDGGGLYAMERKPGSCFRCGEAGHKANECSNRQRGGNPTCSSCGNAGHSAQDCMRRAGNNQKNGVTCYACGESGHYANECNSERIGKPAMMGDRPNHLRRSTPELTLATLESRMTAHEQKTDKIYACLENLCKTLGDARSLGAQATPHNEPLSILQRQDSAQPHASASPDIPKN